jgi:hypothetical protein
MGNANTCEREQVVVVAGTVDLDDYDRVTELRVSLTLLEDTPCVHGTTSFRGVEGTIEAETTSLWHK